MLAEEEYHTSMGEAWYRRLAGSGGESRRLLASATQEMLPGLVSWVGVDDTAARRMVALGVLDSSEARLNAFRDKVREFVALVGMDIDTVIGISEWDEVRGRSAGRPDEEACQRARGDRNRALLVE
jgi:1,2-phenylacetyl-CoA epoxidase catalytic subunit